MYLALSSDSHQTPPAGSFVSVAGTGGAAYSHCAAEGTAQAHKLQAVRMIVMASTFPGVMINPALKIERVVARLYITCLLVSFSESGWLATGLFADVVTAA
ncbi:hypothetical protein AB833_08445 [Chromatiales bacterium (ex Bugula neritina AB1)]|nr:hypothetical protein AB833_08445 [Chromatiales bacterium (ex Bugula neritina AB1)]